MSAVRRTKLRWVGVGVGPRPSATGFGDLLRAYDRLGPSQLPMVARLLGYTCKTPAPEVPLPSFPTKAPGDEIDIEITEGEPGPPPVRRLPGELDPACFLRVKSCVDRQPNYDVPRDFGPPLKLEDVTGNNRGQAFSRRRGPPLAIWARIGAHLRHALGAQCEGKELDVRLLVDSWGRGVLLQRLPRRKRRVWPARIIVVVDRSQRLIPFWQDQQQVVSRLRDEVGLLRVEEHTQIEGPFATTFVTRGRKTHPLRQLRGGGPVIALSDLGLYARDAGRSRRAWQRYARVMSRAGHQLTALVPVPTWRWQPEVTRIWSAYTWERATRGTRTSGAQRRMQQSQMQARKILELASLSSRVEPGLLRELRLLFPGADVGAEADAWNHPDVFGSTCVGLSFRNSDIQLQFRKQFSEYPEPMRTAAVRLILAYHRQLDREIFGEDILHAREMSSKVEVPNEVWSTIRQRILAIAAMLREPEVTLQLRQSYLDWLARLVPRLARGVWNDSEVGDALVQCYTEVRRDRGLELPNGVSPRRLAEFEVNPRPPQTWNVGQVGGSLVLERPRWTDMTSRSFFATVTSSNLEVIFLNSGKSMSSRLSPKTACRIPLGEFRVGTEIVVSTDFTTLTLEGIGPPKWASAMWRDARGLWAKVEYSEHELCWHPPIGDASTTDGTWLAIVPPPWATVMGHDANGLWARIQVGSASATLRWIPPGSFLMGSPEYEDGRYNDEGPQHHVELTAGYWLLDTPCTQELWRAVMDNNPSQFKCMNHPVESVNWNQAAEFCQRLQAQLLVAGDGTRGTFRLPTEAEWEYACRAGATTPTYTGGSEREQLEQLAWYDDNSEGTTQPVAAKRPNEWGLYDMLGNVWEWCADLYAAYNAVPVVNPEGPGEGSYRVIRGGSWGTPARHVRAACRRRNRPDNRLVHLGFRFATDCTIAPE